MTNLIKAVENEQKKYLTDFIGMVNEETTVKGLVSRWQYSNLIPKGKDVGGFSVEQLKAYLIKRKEQATYKAIEKEAKKVSSVWNSGELISVKITVEWKRTQMWGANPSAECWYSYKKDGNTHSGYVVSGSIGGCGYDKLSTAVAKCLGQINEVIKPLYIAKDSDISKKSNEVLGYGSGYGILPYIEGGVGCDCYTRIFDKIGYKFSKVASGKMFDVFTIEKVS